MWRRKRRGRFAAAPCHCSVRERRCSFTRRAPPVSCRGGRAMRGQAALEVAFPTGRSFYRTVQGCNTTTSRSFPGREKGRLLHPTDRPNSARLLSLQFELVGSTRSGSLCAWLTVDTLCTCRRPCFYCCFSCRKRINCMFDFLEAAGAREPGVSVWV